MGFNEKLLKMNKDEYGMERKYNEMEVKMKTSNDEIAMVIYGME